MISDVTCALWHFGPLEHHINTLAQLDPAEVHQDSSVQPLCVLVVTGNHR